MVVVGFVVVVVVGFDVVVGIALRRLLIPFKYFKTYYSILLIASIILFVFFSFLYIYVVLIHCKMNDYIQEGKYLLLLKDTVNSYCQYLKILITNIFLKHFICF